MRNEKGGYEGLYVDGYQIDTGMIEVPRDLIERIARELLATYEINERLTETRKSMLKLLADELGVWA